MARLTFDRVTRMHRRVGGTTPEGVAYQAMEPELLTWVHVTAAWGFLNAFMRYVDPALPRADQDRYYAEGEVIAKGFGAEWTPTSVAEVDAYMADMRPLLKPNDTIPEFLAIVAEANPFGPLARPVQRLVTDAAVDLLDPGLRAQLNLTSRAPGTIRPLVRGLARTAGLATRFTDGPPQQACRRMGVSMACLR
jgi:uncharacterized protein (DUF2236 family)